MKRRVHIKSNPVNIEKLIKSLGPVQAAVSLGITPNAIKKYVREGVAPKATELAAQSIVASNVNRDQVAVVNGSADLIGAIKAIVAMGGGGFKEI